MYPQADTLPMSYIPFGVLSVNTYKSTALVKWTVSQIAGEVHVSTSRHSTNELHSIRCAICEHT